MSHVAPRTGFALAVPPLLSLLLFGCQSGQKNADKPTAVTEPVALESPAGEASRYPNLSVDAENRVYLTWFEERGESTQALLWSRLEDNQWSEPMVIAEGDSFFVNWADFPGLLPLDGDRLVAHWPWMSGGDTYSYDVRMAYSTDSGHSWSGPIIPHHDGTPTEHGFVSLTPEDGGVRVVWLDGRNFAGHGGHGEHGDDGSAGPSMTLRTAVLSFAGTVTGSELIDGRTCDCCPTSMVATSSGIIVAYRDRDDSEIRDISLVRHDDAGWSDPVAVHGDGWKIAGCPVNGPALAAQGDVITAAWYSEAGDQARVLAAVSYDGGKTFGAPMVLDDGDPIGRVAAVQLEDGSVLVTWLERDESGAQIRLRQLRADGSLAPATRIAEASADRAGGFPRVVRAGDRLIFAWTEVGDPPRVRLVQSRIPG